MSSNTFPVAFQLSLIYILIFLQPRSADAYQAARQWLAPGCKLICCICDGICMEPASCIRRGDSGTDAIRKEIDFLETQYPNFEASDHQKVYSKISNLWRDISNYEEESRAVRKACCSPQAFICRSCIWKHLRNQRHRHERCPLCRSILAFHTLNATR